MRHVGRRSDLLPPVQSKFSAESRFVVSLPTDRPTLGITLRIVAGLLFAGMVLSVKLASDEIPLGQIVFFRSAFAMLPLLVFMLIRKEFPRALKTKRLSGHLVRSGLGATSMFFSFSGIARLPVADSTLVGYMTPLFTTVFAGVLLKESITKTRIAGVGLGLAGVLVLTVPQMFGSGFDVTRIAGYGFGVTASLLSAGAMIQVRRLGATETTSSIAFYFALVATIFGLATFPLGWVMPTGTELIALLAAGILGGTAQIALTLSYQFAEASAMAPFEYLSLFWASGIDVFIFKISLSPWFFAAVPLILLSAIVSAGVLNRRRSIHRVRRQ